MDAKPLDLLIVDHEATFVNTLKLFAETVGVSVVVIPNARDVAAYLQDMSNEELPKAYFVRLRIPYNLETQLSAAGQIEKQIREDILIVAHPDEMRAPVQIYDSLQGRGVDMAQFYFLTIFDENFDEELKQPLIHADQSTGITLVNVFHRDVSEYLFSLVDCLSSQKK